MNDDTIGNLIDYGDDKDSENTASEETKKTEEVTEKKAEVTETAEEASEMAETGDTEQDEKSSLGKNDTEDTGEEYFSSDNETEEPDKDKEEEYEFFDDTDFEALPTEKMPRKKIITLVVTAAAVFILMTAFSLTDTGAIGRYKRNFASNIGKIAANMGIDLSKPEIPGTAPVTDTSSIAENSVSDGTKQEQMEVKATPAASAEPEYRTEADYANMAPFESAASAGFAAYRKGIVCAKTNYLCYMNAAGTLEWELVTSVVDPILKAEGDFILIAQRDGTKICLYEGNKLLYDTDTDGSILNCSVSSNGDAVAVVDRNAYKGAFSVYNKNGSEIYKWSSGSDLILSADISSGSRRVAAATLNTDSKVKSSVLLFNINKENSYAGREFNDTILFDIVFSDDNINAFGDNAMIGMNTSGSVLYDKRFDDVELVNYAMDGKGTKVMAFNSGNIPMMNVYNSAGALKYTVTVQSQPDCVDVDSYNIIYNDNRSIFLGKPNSRIMSKYTATMDIKHLVILDSRTFVIVYSNSLEFVRMK